MSDIGTELLARTATAAFAGSYFLVRPSLLRGVQMLDRRLRASMV
jgi:hypothetical protein